MFYEILFVSLTSEEEMLKYQISRNMDCYEHTALSYHCSDTLGRNFGSEGP